MKRCIGDVYYEMDLTCETFPGDTEVNPSAYVDASSTFKAGDVAIIFTPDDTHFDIAMECVKKGMHVMVTKPIVQTLDHHLQLAKLAAEKNVLVGVEVHKRLGKLLRMQFLSIRALEYSLLLVFDLTSSD